ncbi:MAG: phosphotyrosine protein phosphatase [Bacteroidota bacterium]
MRHILFVCGKNKLRSPTAEAIFCDQGGYEVRSAGLNNDAEVPLGAEDVKWADLIFLMEKTHKTKLQKRFKSFLKNQKLIVLDIPDEYDFMEEALVRILTEKVSRFLT